MGRIKREAGLVLGSHEGWQLYERPYVAGSQWRNFALVSPKGSRKRKFYGAHNGERLARSTDMGLLSGFYPNIYQWLTTVLGLPKA
jgi:hypothetical protein